MGGHGWTWTDRDGQGWTWLCVILPERGAHFQKNHKINRSENEKWSRKTLDGKHDGYMWGLGGAKKRKC